MVAPIVRMQVVADELDCCITVSLQDEELRTTSELNFRQELEAIRKRHIGRNFLFLTAFLIALSAAVPANSYNQQSDICYPLSSSLEIIRFLAPVEVYLLCLAVVPMDRRGVAPQVELIFTAWVLTVTFAAQTLGIVLLHWRAAYREGGRWDGDAMSGPAAVA